MPHRRLAPDGEVDGALLMKYAEARPLMRSGDLLGFSHERWGSWYDLKVQAVRFARRSVYCHVGAVFLGPGSRVMCWEAVSQGIRLHPLRYLLPFWWVPMRAQWEDEVEEWACDQLGEPYSEWQALLGGLGLLEPGVDRIWQCAEAYHELAWRQKTPLNCGLTPDEIMLAAQKLPGTLTHYVEADEG